MENKLVSIIIPVYNAEKYIKKCMEGVLSQTYNNLEIIIIDDGSVDNSLEICRDYEKKDERVLVCYQDNMGVAKARYNALLKATSDYVVFVDADDVVDAEYVNSLMQIDENIDLVTEGVLKEVSSDRSIVRYDGIPEGKYTTDNELQYIWDNMIFYSEKMDDGILPYIYAKRFKRKMAIEIMEELNSTLYIDEDRAFVLCLLQKCRSVFVKHEHHYIYKYIIQSAFRSKHKDYLTNLNRYYILLDDFFSKYYYSSKLRSDLQRFIVSRLSNASKYMDFIWDARIIKYYHPFSEYIGNKKIVIYGAGIVGIDYYKELRAEIGEDNIIWVDKNWESISEKIPYVSSVNQILDEIYDYVIIAVNERELAEIIKKELVDMDIEEGKILWREPIRLYV